MHMCNMTIKSFLCGVFVTTKVPFKCVVCNGITVLQNHIQRFFVCWLVRVGSKAEDFFIALNLSIQVLFLARVLGEDFFFSLVSLKREFLFSVLLKLKTKQLLILRWKEKLLSLMTLLVKSKHFPSTEAYTSDILLWSDIFIFFWNKQEGNVDWLSCCLPHCLPASNIFRSLHITYFASASQLLMWARTETPTPSSFL